jgi:hypothetical protein
MVICKREGRKSFEIEGGQAHKREEAREGRNRAFVRWMGRLETPFYPQSNYKRREYNRSGSTSRSTQTLTGPGKSHSWGRNKRRLVGEGPKDAMGGTADRPSGTDHQW